MDISISRLTINQLMLSNVHLGDNCSFLDPKIKPFLLGYKNNHHVINLLLSQNQLKLLSQVVLNLIINRQKILIIKDLDFYNLGLNLNYKNVFYFHTKWIGGLLTNFRTVRKSKKFLKEIKTNNDLKDLKYMPSLVFLFDTKVSKWPLFEAYNLEIPIGSVVNSSSPYSNMINYLLVGNNKSFESIFLYTNILQNAIIKGKQKERLKILRIL